MIDKQFEKEEFKKSVKENVKFLYRKTLEEATQEQIFQAVTLVHTARLRRLLRSLDLTLTASKTRSRIRLLETVDLEDWQHASWILLQL